MEKQKIKNEFTQDDMVELDRQEGLAREIGKCIFLHDEYMTNKDRAERKSWDGIAAFEDTKKAMDVLLEKLYPYTVEVPDHVEA